MEENASRTHIYTLIQINSLQLLRLGYMDPEGILKGSKQKLLMIKAAKIA